MDVFTTAKATKTAITGAPAAFMLDMDTYARGGELGFAGMDFYTAGRGGAIGEVDADVVSAGFVFFNPVTVREQWERARGVMSPADAARAFIGVGYAWAAANLPDDVDYARLAELAGKVVDGASPAAAPLFAAWRVFAEPTDPRSLAFHRLNLLRELRGALHGACVLGAGLTAEQAAQINDPVMAGIFGWGPAGEDIADLRATWEAAEAATHRAVAGTFAALDEGEREEFVNLARSIWPLT